MNKETVIPISYQIAKLATEKFTTYDNVSIDENSILMYSNANFQVSAYERSVRCTFEFGLMSHEETFIELTASVYFLIRKESWDILPVMDGKKELPMSFAYHITQIAISTTRGILHVKTEGTYLNKYFIPDLNPEDLVKTQLLIEV